jgi:hypothetical protein
VSHRCMRALKVLQSVLLLVLQLVRWWGLSWGLQ